MIGGNNRQKSTIATSAMITDALALTDNINGVFGLTLSGAGTIAVGNVGNIFAMNNSATLYFILYAMNKNA